MTTMKVQCINSTKAMNTAKNFLNSVPKEERKNVDIDFIEKTESEKYSKIKMHKSDMIVSKEIPHFEHTSESYFLEFDFEDDKYKEMIQKALEKSKGFIEPEDFGRKSTFDYEA